LHAAFDTDVQEALQIPPLLHAEAEQLATLVFARFVGLLEELTPAQWLAPTYCTNWRVREIVAHEAGGYESGLSLNAFCRTWLRLPERGRSWVDTINAAQVRARVAHSPAQLLSELRAVGPRAIAARGRLSPVVRTLPIPVPPMGLRRADFLTDAVYLRDAWIHTIDIAHATGQPLRLDVDLDGRIVALLVRDLAPRLTRTLRSRTLLLHLEGPAGGCFRIGPPAPPDAAIRMDAVDFALRSSERITTDDAQARSQLSGDIALSRAALERSFILY
jgi:uncharacterized protein (TIGR03083 family)